jgi:hypothetical protein
MPLRSSFPIYIPTKGRSATRLTSNALTAQGVPHYLVVEPQEVDLYRAASAGSLATVLPLDLGFKVSYELCDDLGLTKSTGPGPARNFAWEHSRANGSAWHWVMDDNIAGFFRLHENQKVRCTSAAFWLAQEDFVLRYTNVGMAGPNYFMFAKCRKKLPPYITNTRIYSCNLIRNDLPYRWRGRYNEDTILSLDLLKAGWCTIQFNAFLQNKVTTQTRSGGNTAEFYAAEGTAPKSAMLKVVHPDVTRLVHKFGRVHHSVQYKGFTQPLLRDLTRVVAPTDYGLKLVPR